MRFTSRGTLRQCPAERPAGHRLRRLVVTTRPGARQARPRGQQRQRSRHRARRRGDGAPRPARRRPRTGAGRATVRRLAEVIAARTGAPVPDVLQGPSANPRTTSTGWAPPRRQRPWASGASASSRRARRCWRTTWSRRGRRRGSPRDAAWRKGPRAFRRPALAGALTNRTRRLPDSGEPRTEKSSANPSHLSRSASR